MTYDLSYLTDTGRRRRNEDSLVFVRADTAAGAAVLAAVCDGMGGLRCGELASAEMARALERWFRTEFAGFMTDCGKQTHQIANSLASCVFETDRRLAKYGEHQGFRLGTTASILFLLGRHFYIVNVGDSRIYRYRRGRLHQLTHDQTLAARLVREGLLSAEDAETCVEGNVLLMSIGAGEKLEMETRSGRVRRGDVFLLCTDGFRRRVSSTEICRELKKIAEPPARRRAALAGTNLHDEIAEPPLSLDSTMAADSHRSAAIATTSHHVAAAGPEPRLALKRIAKLVYTRGECDNITAVIVRSL